MLGVRPKSNFSRLLVLINKRQAVTLARDGMQRTYLTVFDRDFVTQVLPLASACFLAAYLVNALIVCQPFFLV